MEHKIFCLCFNLFLTPKGKVFHFDALLVFLAISRKCSHKTNEKSIKEEEKVFATYLIINLLLLFLFLP
jgi:hypothetical protein